MEAVMYERFSIEVEADNLEYAEAIAEIKANEYNKQEVLEISEDSYMTVDILKGFNEGDDLDD